MFALLCVVGSYLGAIVSIADDYRQHAAACLRAAQAAQVEHVKTTLVAMAQRRNEAAEREERFAAESADWKELGPSGQNIR